MTNADYNKFLQVVEECKAISVHRGRFLVLTKTRGWQSHPLSLNQLRKICQTTYTYNDDGDLTEKENTDTGLKYVYDGDNVSVYKTSDNSLVQSYTSTETEANEETGAEAYTTVTENHFGTEYTSVSREKSVSYTTGDNTAEYSYQTTGTDEDEKLSADSVVADAIITTYFTNFAEFTLTIEDAQEYVYSISPTKRVRGWRDIEVKLYI